MYSHKTVKDILEAAIDSLVDNFAREPYIHRCEHSIHCELYNMLNVHRALQGLYRLKGHGEHSTTLIHKGWPETNARPEKQGRRGNFDLAILDPERITEHTIEDFTAGRIRPAFVVEIGLNYGLDHLRNDDGKLKNSGCRDGYLLLLWQPHKPIPDADLRKLQEWCSGKSNVASVVFKKYVPLIKRLKDPALTLEERETRLPTASSGDVLKAAPEEGL